MNLDFVKNNIAKELGISHHFLLSGSRNQIREFEGTIIKVFPAIFIIELKDGSILSFSYGDYVIKNIKIIS